MTINRQGVITRFSLIPLLPAATACSVGGGDFRSMQVCILEETMVKEPEKCRQVLQTARPLPSTLQVGHICRRNTRYRMAKQAIEEGLNRQGRGDEFGKEHSPGPDTRDHAHCQTRLW